MNHRPRQLLQWRCSKRHGRPSRFKFLGKRAVRSLALKLAGQEVVVFPTNAPTELDQYNEKNCANTGRGKHAIVLDLPSSGQEAGIDGVKIEHHLVFG